MVTDDLARLGAHTQLAERLGATANFCEMRRGYTRFNNEDLTLFADLANKLQEAVEDYRKWFKCHEVLKEQEGDKV